MGPADIVTLQLDATGRVSKTLAGTRVLFGGIEGALVYVSATQVSAIVPYAVAGRATTSVQVEYNGVRSNSMTMDVATTAPGLFTVNSSGSGAGAILNGDGTLNSAANGAARGRVVVVYATGEGQTIPLGVDGKVNNDPLSLPAPVAARDGDHRRPAGPGALRGRRADLVSGVMQINLEVPQGASTGAVPVVITVGNTSSQANVTLVGQVGAPSPLFSRAGRTRPAFCCLYEISPGRAARVRRSR